MLTFVIGSYYEVENVWAQQVITEEIKTFISDMDFHWLSQA